VTTKQTSLGTILVTSSGQTLYLDVGDKAGHWASTGMCAAAWPVLSTSGKPRAAGKAKASDLGTIKHGKLTQVTYGGHPLYTFTADTKGSPTSGQGVNGSTS
jgi:predicted lipoprotein with Yx(FWY)xxD motif